MSAATCPRSDQCVWRSSDPPSVGWWPASVLRDASVLRWWNGKRWSYPARHFDDDTEAATAAKNLEPRGSVIFWTDPWW